MKGTDDMQKLFFNRDGREIWPCKYCDKEYVISGGTLNIEKHLWEKHTIFEESPIEIKLKSQQLSIQESMASSEANPLKRRKLTQETSGEKLLDAGTVESLFVKWLASDNQALRLVDCPEFRAFLTYLNANINVYLPSSHTTVGEWVLRQYDIEKDRIRQRLQSARSKIHISCDLWTSPNSLPILGVVAHYISEDNILEHSVLAMKELQGKHEGENIAPVIIQVLEDWGILSKVGFFQMDNAGNNDTMIKHFSRILQVDHDIKYDYKLHRIRCQGHIINLSVQSFLFVTDSENLEDDTLTIKEKKEALKVIEEWRKKGPLGMLHNFIVYLQTSVQRMQDFLRLSKGRRPARDNATRWSSWAKCLKIATSSPVYEAIVAYFEDYADEECKLDKLSDEDWELLRQVHKFLDSLAQTTKALESNVVTLDKVLPAMDFILKRFEDGKAQFADHLHLSKMFNSGWMKMNKYYKMTDETPVYVAALVLNPKWKWSYIHKNWDKAWYAKSKRLLDDLWELYKPQNIIVPLPPKPKTTNEFLLFLEQQEVTEQVLDDELAHYLSQPKLNVHDARAWWMEETQQKLYPNLSKMALDILSIPAMSAEPERLFSATKLMITDQRNLLGMRMIEALACLKSWYKLKDWDKIERMLFVGPVVLPIYPADEDVEQKGGIMG
jgi:hypothetical protein